MSDFVGVFKVTLDLHNTSEKFGSFLRSALDVLSQLLELATLHDIGKVWLNAWRSWNYFCFLEYAGIFNLISNLNLVCVSRQELWRVYEKLICSKLA